MFHFSDSAIFLAELSHLQCRDLLVAMVAIGLGICIISAVLTNNCRCYNLSSVKMMEKNLGRQKTKLILLFVGGACVMMGAHLVAQATNPRKNASNQPLGSTIPLAGFDTQMR